MKIYENDKGEKFVESGEVRYPKQGEWYGHPITMYPTRALLDHSQSHHRILRPATPEEIVESEDKKMCPAGCGLRYDHVRTVSAEEDECPWIQAWIHSRECNRLAPMEQARAYADAHWSEFVKKGEKPKLTLPLVVGQIVVCRDGVERTALHVKGRLAYWTQNATDPCWYKSSGLYWTQGDHGLDAISDSPRWKPEKKDEQEKQERAAGGSCVQDEKTRTVKPVSATPAAPPAILDDDAFYKHVWGFPKPFEIKVPEKRCFEYRGCPVCARNWPGHVSGNPKGLSEEERIILEEVRDDIQDPKLKIDFEVAFLVVPCPECGGTGQQKT